MREREIEKKGGGGGENKENKEEKRVYGMQRDKVKHEYQLCKGEKKKRGGLE